LTVRVDGVTNRAGAAELDLRGGHPAVDFVNTVTWRGDPTRRSDHLVDFASLVGWAWHADLMSSIERRAVHAAGMSDERAARRVLRRAHHLREALHALWTSDSSDTSAVVDEYRAALRNRTLRIAGDRVRWVDQALIVDTPVNRIAIAAVALLDTVALPVVKECGDAACGWLFVDNSHQRSRRWCSSADCGNRARARRHYDHRRSR
jgi:predicted RNA-binding Zn ribbon-like protein